MTDQISSSHPRIIDLLTPALSTPGGRTVAQLTEAAAAAGFRSSQMDNTIRKALQRGIRGRYIEELATEPKSYRLTGSVPSPRHAPVAVPSAPNERDPTTAPVPTVTSDAARVLTEAFERQADRNHAIILEVMSQITSLTSGALDLLQRSIPSATLPPPSQETS